MIGADAGSIDNLRKMLDQADSHDLAEGRLAYVRYHRMLRDLADMYDQEVEPVIAAFAALSPNNDYVGNLRSLVSLLVAKARQEPFEAVTISTYRHCGERAWSYLSGETSFLDTVKGLKIRAFYQNILDPHDPHPVTIDGHMVATWVDKPLVMKEAVIRPKLYEVIAEDIRQLAREFGGAANVIQATIWFTRKRVLNVKYDGQLDLLNPHDANVWKTLIPLEDLQPYGRKA